MTSSGWRDIACRETRFSPAATDCVPTSLNPRPSWKRREASFGGSLSYSQVTRAACDCLAKVKFLHPKGILYGIAVASTFLVPYYHSAPTLTGFAAALALLGIAATSLWALFGSIFRRFMAENHRAVGYVMGALLVYCAVSLFV